jgi:hypothetical protein
MEDWLLIQNFYLGLVPLDRSHLNAIAGGAFFLLIVADAKTLIEKTVSNQGWSDDRLQLHKRGIHSIKEIDMLVAKMDPLTKRVEHYEKVSDQETLKAMDSHMTCKVCGDVGHSSNSCPKTQEDLNFVNTDNGFHPQYQG